VEAVKEIGNVSGATVAVAVVALAVMLPLRWIAPRFPAALVVVVAGIALSTWLNLDQHGVAVVGEIPSGLPSLKFPTPPLNQVIDLLPAALGLFLGARMRTDLKDRLDDVGLGKQIGAERFYPTVRAAVHACVRQETGS
jgi:Sulfate permease family